MKKLVAAGAAIAALMSSTSAMAVIALPEAGNYTFNFVGQCTDCEGNGVATLKVQDYILGTALSQVNFVSFDYAGTNLLNPYSIDYVFNFNGSIGSSPGAYDFNLTGYSTTELYTFFSTNSEGGWTTGHAVPADEGVGGTWRLAAAPGGVPEPATWAMMLIGFGAVGVAMRRKPRQTVRYAFA